MSLQVPPHNSITGAAKCAGVMGWPVAHSKSPILHGWWLAEHGIDGAYIPLPVPPDALSQAAAGLKALGFAGWNVTVPHKQAIMPFMDRLTPRAQAIGAVNTVYRDADGAYVGDNSDAFGFMENLREGLRSSPEQEVNFDGQTALVLGAGGASRAVVWGLLDAGVSQLVIANRSYDKAQALAAEFSVGLGAERSCLACPWDEVGRYLPQTQLLVNATALGMTGKPPLPLDFEALPRTAVVTDLVYTPLMTDLLAWARARGNPYVDGLGMLLHQARPGFAAWFGTQPQVTAAVRAKMLAG